MAKSRKRLRPPSHSLRKVIWVRSSTTDREGFPQRDAVRIIMKLMGFLTLETNSSHASSSLGPAQRKTMSFRDKEEYRVGLGVFDIVLFSGQVLPTRQACLWTQFPQASLPLRIRRCRKSPFVKASPRFGQQYVTTTQSRGHSPKKGSLPRVAQLTRAKLAGENYSTSPAPSCDYAVA